MRTEYLKPSPFDGSSLALELNQRSVSYDTLELISFSTFLQEVGVSFGELCGLISRLDERDLPTVAIIQCDFQCFGSITNGYDMVAIGRYVCVERQMFECLRSDGLAESVQQTLGQCVLNALSPKNTTNH